MSDQGRREAHGGRTGGSRGALDGVDGNRLGPVAGTASEDGELASRGICSAVTNATTTVLPTTGSCSPCDLLPNVIDGRFVWCSSARRTNFERWRADRSPSVLVYWLVKGTAVPGAP